MITQDQSKNKQAIQNQRADGLTLIELVMAIAAVSIVMLTAALLAQSGYRGWNKAFNDANCETRLGALDVMTALGAIGRKSNKINYRLYTVNSGVYQTAVPSASPDEIVTGQAVEFRYWDTELDADIMDPDISATAYALFYLDGDRFKVDYGPYPPGGVDGTLHRITSSDVITVTLAKEIYSVEFSHNAKNMSGDGRGCIRMKLVSIDPSDNSVKTTLAATLMRNVWPQ